MEKSQQHPNWKGDKAKHRSIHQWIKKHKPKPEDGKCELCDKVYDKKGVSELELSTIDHSKKLTHDIEACRYAHRSCHIQYDKKYKFLNWKIVRPYQNRDRVRKVNTENS